MDTITVVRGRPRKPDSEKVKSLPRINLYIPLELWKAIKEHTEQNKIKQNSLILEAINNFLNSRSNYEY